MSDDALSPIGARLKALRSRANKTQREVGAAIDVTEKTMVRAENTGAMSISTVVALAGYYGVSADYILGLSDDPGGRRDAMGGRESRIEPMDDATVGMVESVLTALQQDAQTTQWLRERLAEANWSGVSEGTLRSYATDLLLKKTGRFTLPKAEQPSVRPGATSRTPRRGGRR
jgi:transcriptional regulator with XRE-family HTH domain